MRSSYLQRTGEFSADGMPKTALASASGIRRGKAGRITHRFEEGAVFKMGVTGNAFSGKGLVNSFFARVSIVPASN